MGRNLTSVDLGPCRICRRTDAEADVIWADHETCDRCAERLTERFPDFVKDWIVACFGEESAYDIAQRRNRFLEEALELAQTTGVTAREAHALVDYVFERPAGSFVQEVGGTMVTLAGLCKSLDIDMLSSGVRELDRCWAQMETIRAKEAAREAGSALPGRT